MFNFNKELKLRISELEKKVAETEKMLISQIKENKSLKWKLENPPKYKVGDKIEDSIITEREYVGMGFINMALNLTTIRLMILNMLTTENDKKALKDYLAKNLGSTWRYELVNTVNGDKFKRNEFELMKNSHTSAKVSKK